MVGFEIVAGPSATKWRTMIKKREGDVVQFHVAGNEDFVKRWTQNGVLSALVAATADRFIVWNANDRIRAGYGWYNPQTKKGYINLSGNFRNSISSP